MAQSGDFLKVRIILLSFDTNQIWPQNDGTGSTSMYGDVFNGILPSLNYWLLSNLDENFTLLHSGPGLLSM